MDQEKLQAMLTEHTLAESCDLKRALEIVALLEAQLEEMNPYLESISEYAFRCQFRSRQLKLSFSEFFLCSSLLVIILDTGGKIPCTMDEWRISTQ